MSSSETPKVYLYETSKSVKSVSDGNATFTSKLHEVIHEQVATSANLVYSPFSISTVLAMVSVGAKGNTSNEILSAGEFPEDPSLLAEGYQKTLESLNGTETSRNLYELLTANKVYYQTGNDLQEDFDKTLTTAFGLGPEAVNFGDGAATAEKINNWVSQVTKDKIRDVVLPSSLNASTRLILVNGVYFKAPWKIKFNKGRTTQQKFFQENGETVTVDMMYSGAQRFRLATFNDLKAKAILVPYDGERIQMAIYLPTDEDSKLADLENRFQKSSRSLGDRLKDFKFGCRAESAILHLPRFKFESSINLVQVLQKLGVTDLFTEGTADLSGMLKSPEKLFVSGAMQKAVIEVNEEGTEAAAVTAMGFRCCSGREPVPVQFRVDRPFLYQIIDLETNMILFAGSCMNPAQ